MIRDVRIGNKPLLSLPLRCKRMGDNSNNETLSEYVCLVEWIEKVSREQAKWQKANKLYTTTHAVASLDGQPKNISFIEDQFGICIKDVLF